MHSRRPTRCGFSLIELVLSIGVVGVLLVSMTSVMVLTSRAIPTSKDRDQQATQARANLDMLESDLSMAIEVSSVTSDGFTIKVPDRTGDSLPETIVYEWEDPGDPLTRSMNGSAGAIVLESVDQLEVQFTTETRTTTIAAGTVDSSEVVLASYTAATDQQLPASVATVQALCVVPFVDSDVTHWRLTGFRHAFASSGNSATSYTATIHPQTAAGDINELSLLASASNTPASQTQSQGGGESANASNASMNMSSQGSSASSPNPNENAMQQLTFANVAWQPRDRGLWVVIRPGLVSQFTLPAQSVAADPSYTATGTIVASLTNWTFANRNIAWSYEALGQVRRPGTSTVTTTHATAARVRALLPTGEYLLVQPRMWNEPEVP
jgi:prepilin-type N-terminal cleavage/methylation domain-containing protein